MPRPKPLVPTQMVSFRLAEDSVGWLDEVTADHGMTSRTELIKRMLRHAAADYRAGTWRP